MAGVRTKKQQLEVYFLTKGFIIDDVDDAFNLEESIGEWKKAFDKDRYSALYHLGFINKKEWFSPSVEFIHQIAQTLIKKLSQKPEIELVREAVEVQLTEDEIFSFKDRVPFVVGMEYVDDDWLLDLWESLLKVFQFEIKNYDGTVKRYFTEYDSNMNIVGRVFFHLVENKNHQYPFAFMATYTTKTVKSKRAIHTPLKNALSEFKGEDRKLISLISSVVKVADNSSFISDLLESGELFSPLKLTVDEAYTILKEIEIYEEAGIMCRVPNWWRKKSNAIGVSIKIGEKEPSKIGLKEIIDFSPTFKLGDEDITEKELREFIKMSEGLIQYKGKWVEINKKKLEDALNAFERVKDLAFDEDLTLAEAMRLELNMDKVLDIEADGIEVSISNGQWLQELRKLILSPKTMKKSNIAPSFHGILRKYQKKGYYWLNTMWQYGFGVCLADDMGLGKTVQIIAFLEDKRINNSGMALLILPASLIGNWQKEIEKFTPEMPYQILHKSSLKSSQTIQFKEGKFLYITTYGMASRLEELNEKNWEYLILDEAQAIKNPGTKQTRAIKSIPAKMKIAMTGTPIENRLSDLWSLFDFLNQGLLGTAKEFTKFTKELKDNAMGYGKLRKMIQPFMLRRLKTDKAIISDLPDKMEMNEYTDLSKKQIALYKQLIKQIEKKLLESEGMERKGLILSSIMKFKQICNHPDQYLGREEYKASQSGKFEKLREICETIYEKKEKVIVFTQFKEMTTPIADFLKEIFHKEGFVFHGSTPVKKRSEMVKEFNSDRYVPYMVMSLKAGGVGLNLTAANHVIHFDRWWNPAVENQATDRVFRIGQTKNVMVHKFVTQGTIEEKIDSIIAEKQNISQDLLTSGEEKWITEYDNRELMKIFSLGGDL